MTTKADKDAHDIVAKAGTCEYCRAAKATDPHEILRGSLRRLARGERCCTLALCRECHNKMGGMSWERQVLILFRSRPKDCDVLRFWKIADRRKPTIEELMAEAMKWGAENAIR